VSYRRRGWMLLGLGLLVTAISYFQTAWAGGGKYVIAVGLIGVGLYYLAKHSDLSQERRQIQHAEEQGALSFSPAETEALQSWLSTISADTVPQRFQQSIEARPPEGGQTFDIRLPIGEWWSTSEVLGGSIYHWSGPPRGHLETALHKMKTLILQVRGIR
jgi:hypothetical protein